MAETTTVPVKQTNGLARHREPLDIFDTLQEEMARFWGQTWPFSFRPLVRRLGEPLAMRTPWAPRLDVFEKDGKLVVKAELPGVTKEGIHVTLDHGDLVIEGERKAESEVKEENYYRMERSFGSFYRRLPLPTEVDPETIEATFTDGVLEVQVPKAAEEKAEARKIPVR